MGEGGSAVASRVQVLVGLVLAEILILVGIDFLLAWWASLVLWSPLALFNWWFLRRRGRRRHQIKQAIELAVQRTNKQLQRKNEKGLAVGYLRLPAKRARELAKAARWN